MCLLWVNLVSEVLVYEFLMLLQNIGFAGLFDVLSSKPVLNEVRYNTSLFSSLPLVWKSFKIWKSRQIVKEGPQKVVYMYNV